MVKAKAKSTPAAPPAPPAPPAPVAPVTPSPPADEEVFTRGEMRLCKAPGCGKRYPAYVARQRFCGLNCRARAFYWGFKTAHGGKRYSTRYETAKAKKARAKRRQERQRGQLAQEPEPEQEQEQEQPLVLVQPTQEEDPAS